MIFFRFDIVFLAHDFQFRAVDYESYDYIELNYSYAVEICGFAISNANEIINSPFIQTTDSGTSAKKLLDTLYIYAIGCYILVVITRPYIHINEILRT